MSPVRRQYVVDMQLFATPADATVEEGLSLVCRVYIQRNWSVSCYLGYMYFYFFLFLCRRICPF